MRCQTGIILRKFLDCTGGLSSFPFPLPFLPSPFPFPPLPFPLEVGPLTPLSSPPPLFPPSPSLPFPSLPLEVGLLIAARGFGGAL